MTRSDLIEAVALKMNVSQRTAEHVVTAMFDSMTDALVSGDRVEIRGLGSWQVKEYDGYTGRNPKTGELVDVKPKKTPFFKAGKDLKERIMEGGE